MSWVDADTREIFLFNYHTRTRKAYSRHQLLVCARHYSPSDVLEMTYLISHSVHIIFIATTGVALLGPSLQKNSPQNATQITITCTSRPKDAVQSGKVIP